MMPTIIHSSSIKKSLRRAVRESAHSFIETDSDGPDSTGLLKDWGLLEISLAPLSDSERAQGEREYINGIANLSARHASLEWWANPISEKNEHTSSHYRHLVLFYRIVKTLKQCSQKNGSLLIICHQDLKGQLERYCRVNEIGFESLDNPILIRTKALYGGMYFLLFVIYYLLATILRKLLLTASMGTLSEKTLSDGTSYVIRSWIDRRFCEGEDPSSLPFFGKLPHYLAKKGYRLILLAGITENYRSMLKKIKTFRDFTVIPEEFFVRYRDIARVIPYLRLRRSRLQDPVQFNGLDVTMLYEEELNKGFRSPEYLKNILRYFMARRFAERVRFSHYIQTFENYAWEKMMLLGIRDGQGGGTTLGFQHAFISRNSFKYFPGQAEQDIVPLPCRIITRGEITRNIMLQYGHYRPDRLLTGCALRQEYLHGTASLPRRHHNRVVVPLTMVPRESTRILNFLMDSALPASGITVVIRCHPMAPPETFAKLLTRKVPDNFVFSNEKSVQEELATTDLVLYTWTTVAIEAVMMGIPVIYLDILTPLFVDPLFECAAFKRTVTKSSDLLGTLQGFYSMDAAQFAQERETASVYLKKDFYPVTEENLAPFYAA